MFDVGSILAYLDIGWDGNTEHHDLDRDGDITSNDVVYIPGSAESKLWWKNVMEPYVRDNVEQEWIDEYGDRLTGGYRGKPIVDGSHGESFGNLEYMVDKLRITQGLSAFSAKRIALKLLNLQS